ncbi:MAG: ArsR family transcriptional regulator [Brevundimonas sp.]|uniref:ArsR family transcriptional regulator n=1 Tax=Brevundimonas sp. TaxID=1871086 RepID=UPI0027355132|nr:ArsR family transcriptional regulator [Brevundimonas sp.]MDP3378692.1 ArsR family transcriptional regulator [Brevundimonas sp.]
MNRSGPDQSAKPAVSQHLSVLENAGLVTSEKKGQFVHYSLVADALANTLNGYVQEVCPVSRPLKMESAALAAKPARPTPD